MIEKRMARRSLDRILLIGDAQRQVEAALAQAMPGLGIAHADNYFEGLAELSSQRFGAVLANAEPIERRPDAAVKALRELSRDGRVILFGHPTLEPLSRKMLEFGCDDYVISPPQPGELQKLLATPVMRIAPSAEGEPADHQAGTFLVSVRLADLMLEALVSHPGTAGSWCVRAINDQIGPDFVLSYSSEMPQTPAALSAPKGSPGWTASRVAASKSLKTELT